MERHRDTATNAESRGITQVRLDLPFAANACGVPDIRGAATAGVRHAWIHATVVLSFIEVAPRARQRRPEHPTRDTAVVGLGAEIREACESERLHDVEHRA